MRSRRIQLRLKRENIAPAPHPIMGHAGRFAGGKALVVLGGLSSARWSELSDRIRPDVILGGNGVNAMIYGLDYWMCAENMTVPNNQAAIGDPRAMEFMSMFHRQAGARVKLISHWSWKLLRDKENCISIRRQGYGPGETPADFSLRSYGLGFMNGWVFGDRQAIRVPTCVGTVGSHLLHLAGILGVAEVHTIGFDLIFRDTRRHHIYEYPPYEPDRFRRDGMFVRYKGVDTQKIWIQTAQFLKSMEPYFRSAGLAWIDHSDGLLQMEGLKCAEPLHSYPSPSTTTH